MKMQSPSQNVNYKKNAKQYKSQAQLGIIEIKSIKSAMRSQIFLFIALLLFFQLLLSINNISNCKSNHAQFYSINLQIYFFIKHKIMTSKKDWNQISDDQNDSQPQQIHQIQILQPIPTLSKILSTPLPEKKFSSNQQQNLSRLQNFEGQQIWLFVPMYYRDNVEEIDKILRSFDLFKECRKFEKGWNVLVPRQNAKDLILNGKKQKQFFLKFYFSNKNDAKGEERPTLYSKKSMPNKTYGQKKRYMLKSPNTKYQVKLESKNYEQKKAQTPKQQKNPKQQAKNEQKILNGSKGYNDKTSKIKRTGNQESNQNDNQKKSYKLKYKQKQSDNNSVNKQKSGKPISISQVQSPKKKSYTLKHKEEQQKKQGVITKQQNKKQSLKQQQDRLAREQQSGSEQQKQSEKIVQKSHKKKKKNNKKKQLVRDSNNPFSMLESY